MNGPSARFEHWRVPVKKVLGRVWLRIGRESNFILGLGLFDLSRFVDRVAELSWLR
jgi:hypothetical protein